MELIVFVEENCNACEKLKTKLNAMNAEYVTADIHDPAIDRIKASAAMAILAENKMEMPVAVLDGIGLTAEQLLKFESFIKNSAE